jgi:hypothetical protein
LAKSSSIVNAGEKMYQRAGVKGPDPTFVSPDAK